MIHLNRETPAPNFCLPSNRGGEVCLADFRQRQPVLLLFLDAPERAPARTLLNDFAAHHDDFRAWEAEVLAIAPTPLKDDRLPFPALIDAGGKVRAQYAGDGAAAIFILDRYTAPYHWQVAETAGALMSATEALEWLRLAEFSCTMCDDAGVEWELSLSLIESERRL